MQGALPDIRIQIVFYIFSVHAVFAMGCMFFGAVPYYHYFGEKETLIGLWTSLACLVLSFMAITVLVWRKAHINVAILGGLVFWVSAIELVGFASATLVNIAPIQFMAICVSAVHFHCGLHSFLSETHFNANCNCGANCCDTCGLGSFNLRIHCGSRLDWRRRFAAPIGCQYYVQCKGYSCN